HDQQLRLRPFQPQGVRSREAGAAEGDRHHLAAGPAGARHLPAGDGPGAAREVRSDVRERASRPVEPAPRGRMNDRVGAAPLARRNATVAQAMAAALKRHGVELTFGQSIPSQLHLAAPDCGIRQITYRTENAGAVMADAFARVSHQVAVVTAQNGPAATLLVPGLAEALTASIPLVAIVQDVARGNFDRNAFQELDHLKLFAGCTKWVRRIHTADRVEDYVDMAFAAAAGGRPGPAVLLVPYDLLGEAAGAAPARTASLGRYPLDRMVADPAQVAAAADLLARAERPLVVAGGGVHLSDAVPALAQLQETCALPVATTAMGKGAVDESHPLSVGVTGY